MSPTAKTTFAARNALTGAAAEVNRLELTNDEERAVFRRGGGVCTGGI
jgi:hypothetical protein